MKTYIGIDVGKNGGVAVIHPSGKYEAFKTPSTRTEMVSVFELYSRMASAVTYGIEKVHAMPSQGVTSMFNFGKIYGETLMVVEAKKRIFYDNVIDITPQKWMKHYGMKKDKGETNTSWKNRLKDLAQELFPDIKVTLYTADALLIANYLKATCEDEG